MTSGSRWNPMCVAFLGAALVVCGKDRVGVALLMLCAVTSQQSANQRRNLSLWLLAALHVTGTFGNHILPRAVASQLPRIVPSWSGKLCAAQATVELALSCEPPASTGIPQKMARVQHFTPCADVLSLVLLPWSSTLLVGTCCLLFLSCAHL